MPQILQHKFQYTVSFDLGSGESVTFNNPDELRMPQVTWATIKFFNGKLNKELHGKGRPSYGEFVVKGALDLSVDGSNLGKTISSLESMSDNLNDQCDITVSQFDQKNDISFVTVLRGCSLVGYKLDDLSRTADDAVCSVELTFQPTSVSRLSGPQTL